MPVAPYVIVVLENDKAPRKQRIRLSRPAFDYIRAVNRVFSFDCATVSQVFMETRAQRVFWRPAPSAGSLAGPTSWA